jgi:hypothetical protein
MFVTPKVLALPCYPEITYGNLPLAAVHQLQTVFGKHAIRVKKVTKGKCDSMIEYFVEIFR